MSCKRFRAQHTSENEQDLYVEATWVLLLPLLAIAVEWFVTSRFAFLMSSLFIHFVDDATQSHSANTPTKFF